MSHAEAAQVRLDPSQQGRAKPAPPMAPADGEQQHLAEGGRSVRHEAARGQHRLAGAAPRGEDGRVPRVEDVSEEVAPVVGDIARGQPLAEAPRTECAAACAREPLTEPYLARRNPVARSGKRAAGSQRRSTGIHTGSESRVPRSAAQPREIVSRTEAESSQAWRALAGSPSNVRTITYNYVHFRFDAYVQLRTITHNYVQLRTLRTYNYVQLRTLRMGDYVDFVEKTLVLQQK